jgi:hypothetical protein
MRINGVDVYVHWSVFAIAGVMLLGVLERPTLTFVAIVAYLSILLIHECGHMIAAQRRGSGSRASSCIRFGASPNLKRPASRFDHCIIAWSGVTAQLLVAIPLIAWTVLFGYTPYEPVNAGLGLLGFFSLFVAAVNLIPVSPLDGAIAWDLIPEAIDRLRNPRPKSQAAGGRR